MSRRSSVVAAWVLALSLPVLYLAAPTLPLPPAARDVVQQLAFVLPFYLAVGGAVRVRRLARGVERRLWSYLAAACGALSITESLVSLHLVLGNRIGTFPVTLAFLLDVSGGALFIAMLLGMTRVADQPRLVWARYMLDTLIVIFVGSGVLMSVVVEPLLAPSDAAPGTLVVASVYMTLGIAICVGTYTNVFGWRVGEWQGWEGPVAFGVSLYGLGVAMWPLWYLGTYVRGPVPPSSVEVLWQSGQALVFVGTVYRARASQRVRELPPAPAAKSMAGTKAAWPVGIAALSASVVLGALHSRGVPTAQGVAITGALMFLLVVRSVLVARAATHSQARRAIDPLTGLEGHRPLRERLSQSIAAAERDGEPLSVIVFDVGQLARVNQTHGRDAGDHLLRELATALSGALHGTTVYRSNGDEFAVVLPDTDAEAAFRLALRTRWDVVAGLATPPELSAGIATFPVTATSGDRLLEMASRAAHLAPRATADRVLTYVDERHECLSRETSSYVRMLRRLAHTVDEREGGSAHGAAVATLARVLAKRLLLSEERIERLALAAELHDIGKVALPDSLLGPSAELGQAERIALRDHVVIGGRMLASEPVRELVPWVLGVHESWDGSGYPRGIAGEEIPLESRIIAVCDAFDRMRREHGQDEALAVLGYERGRRFDPFVVDQFFYSLTQIEALDRVRPQAS